MKKNLTQEELSNLSYINLKTISNMENGNTNYDLDTLETLSTVLKVDLIDKYFDVFYGDSHRIDYIIKSFNEKDMIYGASLDKEINELVQIKDKANRNIIKLKAEKLILFFKGMEEKDKIQKNNVLFQKL
ncbi:MAG: helix-turn-helix domain-containing protein [Anaerococcus sp.]